jgi:glyoxylase-like metal-dependent hydrolase (beta-lactamase superfamily II)/ferredoxin
MASTAKRLPANVPGPFYVDSTCIDCDTCRWMAPETFDEVAEQSRVHHQPATPEEVERASLALVACPTASIGTADRGAAAWARDAFPIPVDGDVYHCGYHSEASFGATSYLVRRPAERGGNILVDSPRFSAPLVRRLEELGGVATMFLTHQDDVADHARFAEHFGCRRVMHADDIGAGTRDVEDVVDGLEPAALDAEALVIPVPGHTAGSACLLYRETYLFSGDHVAWSRDRGHVYAFRSACWYDWETQCDSMERLARHRFEWILPGHGWRCHFPADEMARQMERCVAWMRSSSIEVR